ncbi:hypothetical protein AB0E73_16175, partial [Streptomyces sp. NPDC031705]
PVDLCAGMLVRAVRDQHELERACQALAADPGHMPNADGVSLPLTTPGTVARPKVGLYHFTARESFNTL